MSNHPRPLLALALLLVLVGFQACSKQAPHPVRPPAESKLFAKTGLELDDLDLAGLCYLDHLRRMGLGGYASTGILVERRDPKNAYFVVIANADSPGTLRKDALHTLASTRVFFDQAICPGKSNGAPYASRALLAIVEKVEGGGYRVAAGRAGKATVLTMPNADRREAMKKAFALLETGVGTKLRFGTRRLFPRRSDAAQVRCPSAWCDLD